MLRLQDSLSREKRDFVPLEDRIVRMYNCGPTVYDYVHIGNLRYFLFVDLLRRYLAHAGYEVRQVMNITDVGHMLADADTGEDKMDVAARAAGKTPEEVAKFYTEAFLADMKALGVLPLEDRFRPRASAYVPAMVRLIEELMEKGHAYRVGQDVYYDVSSFPDYGKLSGNKVENLDPGSRIAVRGEKKHPADFALWIHNPKHLMQWEGPQGIQGYPGWHIECSAMARELLGDTVDIHTGGEDNKFPHHECEIAQTEGVTGKPFANFWLHAAHLLVNGEKMSKSKGNFYTLKDLLEKGYSPEEVRFYLLSTHYRQQMNFTFEGLDAAKAGLQRLKALSALLSTGKDLPSAGFDLAERAAAAREEFDRAMDDDLNVSAALGSAFEFVREANLRIAGHQLDQQGRDAAQAFLNVLEEVLGISLAEDAVPEEIASLARQRQEARDQKDFAASDRLRDQIAALGWIVEDTADGQRLKKR